MISSVGLESVNFLLTLHFIIMLEGSSKVIFYMLMEPSCPDRWIMARWVNGSLFILVERTPIFYVFPTQEVVRKLFFAHSVACW